MSNTVLTPESIRSAIDECDRLGPARFRSLYGYRAAQGYVLVFGGKEYDPRAIVGAAFRYQTGEVALRADEFPGRERQRVSWSKLSDTPDIKKVDQLLENLGFEVRPRRSRGAPDRD